MRYVMGIDAGGTKTVCLLADEHGHILAESRGPAGNLKSAGEKGVEQTLRQITGDVLASLDCRPSVVAIGMAGVDRAPEFSALRGIVERLGIARRAVIVNDALIALVAGAGAATAIVLIAGTGSIAYGRTSDGRAARAGGWGYVMGDEGSGYWIGRSALSAVVRQFDGRSPSTSLMPRLLRHFSATTVEDLVRVVYDRGLKPFEIAALAPYVQEAARDGDVVARAILDAATDELVTTAGAVVRRLHLEEEAFTLVLAGGMFKAVPRLSEELPARLAAIAPRCQAKRLLEEPAMGAVRLAIDELHGGAVIPSYVG